MKKTINITIAGLLFTVEEDAYEKLRNYLDGIKAHFASYPEHQDIIDDIEARIAERFGSKAKDSAASIITIADIDELISAMGRVEDFAKEEDKAPRSQAPGRQDVPKRLYRNMDNAIIAGVCSGLAIYFDIDPVIVRLLFAVSLFFGGFGIVLYIILWVVMPEAKTPTEKANMRGAAVTLAGIQQTLKDRVEEFRQRNNGSIKNAAQGSKNALSNLFLALGKIVRVFLQIFGKLIGLVLAISAAAAIFGLTMVLMTIAFNGNSPYVNFPLSGVITGLPFYLIIISAYLSAFIPILFVLMLGSGILTGKSGLNRIATFSLLGLWVISLMSAGVLVGKYGPEIQARAAQSPSFQQTERRIEASNFAGVSAQGASTVTIRRSDTFSVKASGRQADIDRLDISVVDNELVIKRKADTRWCLFCWSDRVKVEVEMPQLTSVSASGASTIEGGEFMQILPLKLGASGASRINLLIAPSHLDATISGASDVTLAAPPILSRSEGPATVRLSGASKLNAAREHFESVHLEASGSSQAHLNSGRKITGQLSGASRLYYYGNAVPEVSVSGGSRLIHEEYLPFENAQ